MSTQPEGGEGVPFLTPVLPPPVLACTNKNEKCGIREGIPAKLRLAPRYTLDFTLTGHAHPFGVLLVEASSGGKNPTGGGKSPNKLLRGGVYMIFSNINL